MVIGDEKSCLPSLLHHIRDALVGVGTHVIGEGFVKLHLFSVANGSAEEVALSVPADLFLCVGGEGDQTHMAGFGIGRTCRARLIYLHLVAN